MTRTSGLIAMVIALCMHTACGDIRARSELEQRVVELQDSLGAYTDSLRVVRTYWTFNKLVPVVRVNDNNPGVGDTVQVDVFLSASNGDHSGYRYAQPRMALVTPLYSRHGFAKADSDGGWHFSYVPETTGEDSITGTIQVPSVGSRDTVILGFTSYLTVTK